MSVKMKLYRNTMQLLLMAILLLLLVGCTPTREYQLQCSDGQKPTFTSNWTTWVVRDSNHREPTYFVQHQGYYRQRAGEICQVYCRFVK